MAEVDKNADATWIAMGVCDDAVEDSTDDNSILDEQGGCGPWHCWIFISMCFVSFMIGNTVASYNFVGYPMKYRCYVPNCDSDPPRYSFENGTFPPYVLMSQDMDMISEGTSCEAQPVDRDECNGTWNGVAPAKEKCGQLIFDQSVVDSSILSTFGLACTNDWFIAVLGGVFNGASMVSATAVGYFGDTFGRRPALFSLAVLSVISGLLTTVMPNIIGYTILRFLQGAGASGAFMLCFVITVETMVPSSVMSLSALLNIVFALGGMFLALESYYIRDWKHLSFFVNIPMAVFCLFFWIFPESPRWLLSTGRASEAQKVIAQVARWNGKDPAIADACMIKQPSVKDLVKKASIKDLFVCPVIRMRLLNMSWQWFSTVLVYYGLTYAATDLFGNSHINLMLTYFMEVLGCSLMILTANWIGRRRLLLFSQLLTGISCIIAGFLMAWENPPPSVSMLSTILCMIGKLGAACSFALIYLYTTELFHTQLRGQSVGICTTLGRFGGSLSYAIKLLDTIWAPLPTVLMALCALSAGIWALFLPETVGSPLPETMEEAVAIKSCTPVYSPFPRSFHDLFLQKMPKRQDY